MAIIIPGDSGIWSRSREEAAAHLRGSRTPAQDRGLPYLQLALQAYPIAKDIGGGIFNAAEQILAGSAERDRQAAEQDLLRKQQQQQGPLYSGGQGDREVMADLAQQMQNRKAAMQADVGNPVRMGGIPMVDQLANGQVVAADLAHRTQHPEMLVQQMPPRDIVVGKQAPAANPNPYGLAVNKSTLNATPVFPMRNEKQFEEFQGPSPKQSIYDVALDAVNAQPNEQFYKRTGTPIRVPSSTGLNVRLNERESPPVGYMQFPQQHAGTQQMPQMPTVEQAAPPKIHPLNELKERALLAGIMGDKAEMQRVMQDYASLGEAGYAPRTFAERRCRRRPRSKAARGRHFPEP